LSLYARQKDLSFGDNIYRYDYHAREDALFMVQENISPMNLGIIPAVGPPQLRSVIAVLDAGDQLLVYAASMVNAVSLPMLDRWVRNSFSTRAEAVIKWFAGRADTALGR
jgi:hypothetical protein